MIPHDSIISCMRKCPDFMDYPTAWAIQKHAKITHGAMCSSVEGWHPLSGPGLLCDCGSVRNEYDRIKNECVALLQSAQQSEVRHD